MGTVLVNQFVVITIGLANPFTSKNVMRLEFFNESMVMISAYNLFVFSDFVDSPHARYVIGYALISVASFNIGVNVFLMVLSTLMGVARLYKMKYLKIKQRIKRYCKNLRVKKEKPEDAVQAKKEKPKGVV